MAAAEETVERDTVVSMFKVLEESMKSLKSDNVAIRERLDNLEAPPQASGVVKDSFKEHVAQDSGSVANTNGDNKIFEESDNESIMDAESETDLQAQSFACQTKIGPKLGAQLALTLNNDLVSQDDFTQVSKLREDYLRPENVPNLRVPKLNEELVLSDNDLTKELVLNNIQQDVTTAITIIADLLNDQSKVNHKYSRQNIFDKANEAASLLMHTHKDITLARKLNVKNILQPGLHSLCTRKHMKESDRTNNRWLFEEDLGGEVDRNFRNKRIVNKVTKNFRSGGHRSPMGVQKYRYQQKGRGRGQTQYAPRGGAPMRGRGRGQIQSRGRGKSPRK